MNPVCCALLLQMKLIRFVCFFCKQKTAYEMRISDWSSDVCSSDLRAGDARPQRLAARPAGLEDGADRQLREPGDAATGAAAGKHRRHRPVRSEERRVGKECVSTSRYRWSTDH